MADGYIEFSTTLDNSDLEKQLKEAEKDVERLKKKLEERESDRNALAEAIEEADEAIKATEDDIESLKKRYEELIAARESGEMDSAAANARIEVVTEELEKQRALYYKQLDAAEALNKKWEKNENDIAALEPELDAAKRRCTELGKEYQKSYGAVPTAFRNGMAAMDARVDAFVGKVTAKLRTLFGLTAIIGLLAQLKQYIMESVRASEQFQAASANLKAVLAGIAAPILNVVIPAFTALVNVISAVLITLAKLVDSVFKTNFSESIRAAQNNLLASTKAQEGATDALKDDTKATKQNAKAKKEAARWLAAFDELNVMAKEQEDEGESPFDSVSPNGMAGVGTEEPTWDGIDVGKIDAKLAEIMLILGAALLAVGAILAFSGINIPLGITLMAIGALLIYTAVEEQWDALPEQVREAITGVLVFTGIVLIVLGVILAFVSPTTTPIGVGMIAAGALMLWAAVAINWDEMPDQIREAVSVLMGILSVALLVLGAILTFTAANPMLGVALMALGAASLAVAVSLNWEQLPEDVKQTVENIAAIVGVAFLVLGAILTMVSPTTAPLGVGLLLIGCASLAASIALQWDKMPQEIRNTVSVIMGIIGASLIVLGVILVVTGVGLPLGVALILAGAGSIAAAVAVNFDAIKDKVKEVWQGIRDWFNSSVAPIFTVSYWQDKFRSIANGLIAALNYGLSAVGGFINLFAEGISGILDWLGVGGWSFRITMPQIPYLAEGAVIPPNREFMAVLGDQSNGTNLEAPESLIRQIVREESGGGNAQVVMLLEQLLAAVQDGQKIYVDRHVLGTTVKRELGNMTLMGGA